MYLLYLLAVTAFSLMHVADVICSGLHCTLVRRPPSLHAAPPPILPAVVLPAFLIQCMPPRPECQSLPPCSVWRSVALCASEQRAC